MRVGFFSFSLSHLVVVVVGDLAVLLVEGSGLVVGVQIVLVDEVRDGRLEGQPPHLQQLRQHVLVLGQRGQEDLPAFRHEQQPGSLGVLLPDVSGDEGRVDDDHLELVVELLRHGLGLVEVEGEERGRLGLELGIQLLPSRGVINEKEENKHRKACAWLAPRQAMKSRAMAWRGRHTFQRRP